MIELRMEQCLKEVLPKPKHQRIFIALKSDSFLILDRPYRSIIAFALDEEEVQEQSEMASNTPAFKQRGRRLRKNRGKSKATSPKDYLPELNEMEHFEFNAPMALAILLIRKQMNDPDWGPEFEMAEQSMREECLSNGVHPVWHQIAERTNYLSQFLAFSKVRRETESSTTSFDTSRLAISPKNTEELAEVITHAIESTIDSSIHLALHRLLNQCQTSNQISKIDNILLQLEGELAGLSILLKFHAQQSLDDQDIKWLKSSKKKVHSQLYNLYLFSIGDNSNWEEIIKLKGKSGLEQELLSLAWENIPDEASTLSSKELQKGISHLEQSSTQLATLEKLKWWRLSALHREGEGKEALKLLGDLSLSPSTDVGALLLFLTSNSPELTESWLAQFLDKLDVDSLSEILVKDHYSNEFQLKLAQQIFDQRGFEIEGERPHLIKSFVLGLDFERLVSILSEDLSLGLSYPFETLIAYHGTPAAVTAEVEHRFATMRFNALQSLSSTECPTYLSSVVEELLILIEGRKSDSDAIMKLLDADVYIDFKPIIHALHHGLSEVIIRNKKLRAVEKKVTSVKKSPLESHLFNIIFTTISVNNIRMAFHNREVDENQLEELEDIVGQPYFTLTNLHTIQELVLDFDLGSEAMVEWYQRHKASSPWQILCRASDYVSKNQQLSAAREYKRIADQISNARTSTKKSNTDEIQSYVEQGIFGIEQEITLYRKSLIHYAHAEHWAEAVDLLNSKASLSSALTKRFQLYLKVSKLAKEDKTTAATRLIRDHVSLPPEEILEGDEQPHHRRNRYDEEELDNLRTYSHALDLPDMPFNGRVMAANTELSRNLSRNRDEFERQYQMLTKESSIDLLGIHELASKASEDTPLLGLKIIERAQHLRNVNEKQRQKLQETEKTIFFKHQEKIPQKHRSQLRELKLKPIVLVDTNILVNALIEEILSLIGMNVGHQRTSQQPINTSDEIDVLPSTGFGDFYRFLRNEAENERIVLHVPEVIQEEMGMFSDISRLERQMNLSMHLAQVNDSEISREVLKEKISQVIATFSTWNNAPQSEQKDSEMDEELKVFFKQHVDVFAEITEAKTKYGATTPRTEIDGMKVYPEKNDLKLLHYAKMISEQSIDSLGVVLIASYDNDFTFISKPLEEQFGISVVRNPRTLHEYI